MTTKPHDALVDGNVLTETALRGTELISEWPVHYVNELMRTARLVRYPRGAEVASQGSHSRDLFVVVSGRLEVSTSTEDGHKYMLAFTTPGHIVRLVRLLEHEPSRYRYHAHVDSQVIHLQAERIVEILDREPALWKDVARLGLRRQRDSLRDLHEHLLGSTRQRLAAALAKLAHLDEAHMQSGQVLNIGLSQTELATMLGVSRQTMNKELRQLSDESVVAAVYKRITILDAGALKRIAGGG